MAGFFQRSLWECLPQKFLGKILSNEPCHILHIVRMLCLELIVDLVDVSHRIRVFLDIESIPREKVFKVYFGGSKCEFKRCLDV